MSTTADLLPLMSNNEKIELFKEAFQLLSDQAKLDFMVKVMSINDAQVQSPTQDRDQAQGQAQPQSLIEGSSKEKTSPEEQEEGKRKAVVSHKKNVYPDEIKKEAVELAIENNNNREAARLIKLRYKAQNLYQNIDEKSIREWREIEKFNKNLDNDKAHRKVRRQIRRIKGVYHDAEVALVAKVKERREKGEHVSRDWILSEALLAAQVYCSRWILTSTNLLKTRSGRNLVNGTMVLDAHLKTLHKQVI